MLEKKTTRQIQWEWSQIPDLSEEDYIYERKVWVSQKSLIEELENIIHSLGEPNFNGENIIKDYHWKEFTDLIIKKLKGEKE
jgi:hypothetical protein